MELYRKDEPEEMPMKTDIEPDFSKLNKNEIILLKAFTDMMLIVGSTKVEQVPHFGTYAEGKMCIFRGEDHIWDTYFIESGKRVRRRIYDDFKDVIARVFREFDTETPNLMEEFKCTLKVAMEHGTDMGDSNLSGGGFTIRMGNR